MWLDHRGLCYRCARIEDKLYRSNHPRPDNIGGEIITSRNVTAYEVKAHPKLPVAKPEDLVRCEECKYARVREGGCVCDKGYWHSETVDGVALMRCECEWFVQDGD